MSAGLLISGDGSILLQPDLDNDPRVSYRMLVPIWEKLRRSSVDIAISHSQQSSIYEFAANECVFFASILHISESGPIAPDNPEEHDDEEVPPVATTIGLIYITPSHILGEVNIGVAIAPVHRGRGFARAAITLLLTWAFEQAGYHRVQAAVMVGPERDQALKLFTGLRFNHEGTRRRQVLDVFSNQYQDVTYMGLLDTAWTMRRYYQHTPHNLWDELFARHQREREDLLAWEMSQSKLKRTQSMETVRIKPDKAVESDHKDDVREDIVMESSRKIAEEELAAHSVGNQFTSRYSGGVSSWINESNGSTSTSERLSPSPGPDFEDTPLDQSQFEYNGRNASCSPPPSESTSSSSTWENISEHGHSSAGSSWDHFEDLSQLSR